MASSYLGGNFLKLPVFVLGNGEVVWVQNAKPAENKNEFFKQGDSYSKYLK